VLVDRSNQSQMIKYQCFLNQTHFLLMITNSAITD
jgi:hypothetical protein